MNALLVRACALKSEKSHYPRRQWWADYSLCLSVTILMMVVGTSVLGLGQMLLGGGATGLSFILAVLGSLGVLARMTAVRYPGQWLRFAAVVALPLLSALWASMWYAAGQYDRSWDGQWYHQEAIIQLKAGWNLLTQWELPQLLPSVYPPLYYPKVAWINAAAVYQLTGNIETGKVFNFMMLGASFFASLAALLAYPRLSLSRSVGVASLLALNPVMLCQILTFQVDGQLSATLLILGAFGFLLMMQYSRLAFWGTVLSLIYLINLKFSGLLYASLYALGLGLAVWRWRQPGGITMPQLAAGLALAFGAGVLVVGFNPYVTNFLSHGDIGYPTREEWFVRSMASMRSAHPANDNPIVRLFYSLFSQGNPMFRAGQADLKFPFIIYPQELLSLGYTDMRTSGFGPLFSGIWCLALALMGMSFVRYGWRFNKVALVVMFMLATVLAHPEGWWARFAPQLWLIPLVLALWGVTRPSAPWVTGLSRLLFILILVNVVIVGSAHIHIHNTENRYIKQALGQLKALSRPIEVSLGTHAANRVRLTDAGIAYRLVSKSQCHQPMSMMASDTWLCNLPQDLHYCPPFSSIQTLENGKPKLIKHCLYRPEPHR